MKIVTSPLQLTYVSEVRIRLDTVGSRNLTNLFLTSICFSQHTGAFFMPLVPESVILLLCCMPDFWQQFSYSVITLQAHIFSFSFFSLLKILYYLTHPVCFGSALPCLPACKFHWSLGLLHWLVKERGSRQLATSDPLSLSLSLPLQSSPYCKPPVIIYGLSTRLWLESFCVKTW